MASIRDKDIEWERKRIFLQAWGDAGFTATGLVGIHTGGPVYAELGTLGIGVVDMEAGDMYTHLLPLPSDADVAQDIRFRVFWSTDSTTAADTVDFVLLYSATAEAEALTTGASALDTTIAQDTHTSGNASALHKTAWGILDADTLTEGDVLHLNVEMDATAVDTAGSEHVYYLGTQMEYTPKRTAGSGMCEEATAPNSA